MTVITNEAYARNLKQPELLFQIWFSPFSSSGVGKLKLKGNSKRPLL